MPNGPDWPRSWIRERLGYELLDAALFAAALTHRSAARPNNERLEFLGDAVLNLLTAEQLFLAYPDADEGDLSRLRARLVSAEPLAEIAAQLGLGEVLQSGPGSSRAAAFAGSRSLPTRSRRSAARCFSIAASRPPAWSSRPGSARASPHCLR